MVPRQSTRETPTIGVLAPKPLVYQSPHELLRGTKHLVSFCLVGLLGFYLGHEPTWSSQAAALVQGDAFQICLAGKPGEGHVVCLGRQLGALLPFLFLGRVPY